MPKKLSKNLVLNPFLHVTSKTHFQVPNLPLFGIDCLNEWPENYWLAAAGVGLQVGKDFEKTRPPLVKMLVVVVAAAQLILYN